MTTRVLSIDGGGVRGIVPALVLAELERRVNAARVAKGRAPAPIGLAFDLVTGTSTGAIVACGLVGAKPGATGVPLATTEELVDVYRLRAREIFPAGLRRSLRAVFTAKHDPEPLEHVLAEICSTSRLSQALRRLVVPAYNPARRAMTIFDSGGGARSAGADYFLRDVLRATTAAPTVFPPTQIPPIAGLELAPFIDGGIALNSPSLLGYALARQELKGSAPDILVVSLGCGDEKKAYAYRQIKRWGYSGWLSPRRRVPILSLVMSAQSEAFHAIMDQLVPTETRYFRFDIDLPSDAAAIDDASPANIARLSDLAARLIVKESKRLDALTALLADAGR